MLGTSDEVQQCECCGRDDLKKTIALSVDDGDPLFFGETCAARALARSAKDVRAMARRADFEKREREAMALRAEHDRRFELGRVWLNERVPELRDQRFEQIEKLGGWQAIQALGFPRH